MTISVWTARKSWRSARDSWNATQRDVVREGVVQIGVTFRVSKKWLNKFSAYKKLASITVGYLDTETMNIVNTQMYIDGYQVKLVSDTSYGSLWEVSFTLKEF